MAFRLPNEIRRLADAIHGNNVASGFEAARGQLVGNDVIAKFVLGGNATFTVENETTGNRFTFKVRAVEERKGAVSHFVSLLSGPDNESDYQYMGQLYRDSFEYGHGQKSRVSQDATSAKALKWLMHRLLTGAAIKEPVRVFHEARCGRCNRKLTVPSSIESGFGPECINHV